MSCSLQYAKRTKSGCYSVKVENAAITADSTSFAPESSVVNSMSRCMSIISLSICLGCLRRYRAGLNHSARSDDAPERQNGTTRWCVHSHILKLCIISIFLIQLTFVVFVGCVTCDTSLQLIVGVLNRGEGFPCPMEVRLKVARGPGGAGSDDEPQPRLIQRAQVRC